MNYSSLLLESVPATYSLFDAFSLGVNIALAIVSISISLFAIHISRAESSRATDMLIFVSRELRGVAIRSERTERTTERAFDTTMRALIAATMAGEQNAANALTRSTHDIMRTVTEALPSGKSITPRERQAIAEKVTESALMAIQSQARPETQQITTEPLSRLQSIIAGSENPPIAERYIQTIAQYPGMLSMESIRTTNYDEYVRILDYLIDKGVIAVEDGRLTLSDDYRSQVGPSNEQGRRSATDAP